jgi:DNA ligase-1
VKRFTELYFEIDGTNRTGEKVEAMVRYFQEAPPADAAWALYFLSGRKLNRSVGSNPMRLWVAEETGLPMWLIEECYDTVGDLAEALALLYPDRERRDDIPLHRLVEERMMPLRALPDPEKRNLLVADWDRMSVQERLVWNKLIMGSFRVGVARTLLERAIARAADLPQPLVAHRLMGEWQPTAEGYAALIAPAGAEAIHHAQPYPFFLAQSVENAAQPLGEVSEWLAEWKWDGIRAQLLRRNGETRIWTRGEELVTDRFPEIAAIGALLPDGTAVDGEILAWDAASEPPQPLPFAALQRRIGRKTLGAKLLAEVPVALVAFDLLEMDGNDLRPTPLVERRARLETLVTQVDTPALRLSPPLVAETWDDLAALRARCREANAEGLMLKRKTSAYGVGRPRGDWWKWKIEPYSLDAVLTAAQPGHGNRANLFTDYTFGVWHEGRLVTIAKAYSGLTNAEIAEVDAFVRRHTLERHGPVRTVEPLLVFELAFEGVQVSTRHKAGLAVRFPRIARQRKDKQPAEADTLETLRNLATLAAPAELEVTP